MAGNNIAGGAWTEVVLNKWNGTKYDPDDLVIGLATGIDFDEDFAVSGLDVLGNLGPLEFNSHGYSCTINMSMFVTKNLGLFNKIVPDRQSVQVDGSLPGWLLTLRSTTSGKEIYAQFAKCVCASAGQQVQANQFVTCNMRWMSFERVKDPQATGGQGGNANSIFDLSLQNGNPLG